MKKRLRFRLSTTQIILLSFLLAIFLGSLLLALPISSQSGKAVPYIDALFTATSATCVTGLVTLPTVTTWSLFGQAVILLLIQIGGLGIITILSGVMIALHHKMGIGERMLIQDAFNLNTLSGLAGFIKKVILGTLAVEGVGALLYMTVFVPDLGARGIWVSVFNSVSAFCNAGIDILANDSLISYVHHPLVNLVTILLIVLGGIGYIVWWDFLRVTKGMRREGLGCFKRLTLHSKIAISTTLLLIVTGAACFFCFEYSNPRTIADFSLYQKIQASFFQSVTTRTAGFATVAQEDLTSASAYLSLLLMFIGGSPVGTAGGVKTVTFAVMIAAAYAAIRNKEDTVLFGRRVARQALSKAIAVIGMSFFILFLSTLALFVAIDAPTMDILYETVSATATVGLTRNLTPLLNTAGKVIVMLTMYLGRIGPISLAIAFGTRGGSQNIIKNPTEDISVG